MHIEFERTDGMGDVFDGVALAVSEVVHRIDAPLVSGTVMRGMLDTVKKRIAEHHIRACHIDLGPEHLFTVSIFSVTHLAEKPEVFLHAPVPVRTLHTRFVHSATPLADFLLSLVINISQTLLYQFFSPCIKLVEIVRSIFFLVPLEPKPLNILFNGIHIFGILFGRIGIVKTKICLAAIFLRQTEVYADAFRMPEMQITVRLRRKTRKDAVHFAGFEICLNDFFEEIQPLWLFNLFLDFFHHIIIFNYFTTYKLTKIPFNSKIFTHFCRWRQFSLNCLTE